LIQAALPRAMLASVPARRRRLREYTPMPGDVYAHLSISPRYAAARHAPTVSSRYAATLTGARNTFEASD